MKKSRFKPKQIETILKELDGCKLAVEVCRDHGISQPTLCNWRKKYIGMNGEELKRLKDLEAVNHRLKQMYTERAVDCELAKEVIAKKL